MVDDFGFFSGSFLDFVCYGFGDVADGGWLAAYVVLLSADVWRGEGEF